MSAPAPPTLFVTGMQRSGTTLLDKLLAGHPEVSLLSQPFPFLFLHAKRQLLRQLGGPEDPYPLGSLFRETRYRPEDLVPFLARLRLDRATLRELFEAMQGWSGQGERFDPGQVAAALDRLAPGDFHATVAQLYRALAHRPAARWCGGKEILCEEFLPYLLDRGCRCLLILRDPRDVVASLNSGRGEDFGGRRKPTLFNLRNWRKSVAFGLALAGRPGFLALRYEDLVAAPLAELDRIAALLGISPFDESWFAAGLRDQAGQPWSGNSSHLAFQGIGRDSVGAYARLLPPDVIAFVEAACQPEMRRLGYAVGLPAEEAPAVLCGFVDPYAGERPELAACDSAASREDEVRRLRLLAEPAGDLRPWFLFDAAYEALRVPG